MTTQAYYLNMTPDYATVPLVVKASQYDDGDRIFEFTILNGDIPYEIPSGSLVRIQGTKPDGKGFSYDNSDSTTGSRKVVSYSGSVVTVVCQQQMVAVPGEVRTEIRIVTSTGDTGSTNFVLQVEAAGLNDDTDVSNTEIPALVALAREQMKRAEEAAENAEGYRDEVVQAADEAANSELHALDYMNSANAYRKDAEAWAVGQRGGVDVSSDDATYQNNAKFYAGQSERSAINSANSATAANGSAEDAEAWAIGERNGVPVSTSDETYKNNSEYYANQSKQSSVEAKGYADTAESALNDVTERIADALGNNNPVTWVDMDTGHLMWEGETFVYSIDYTTGNLMWELAA